MNQPIKNWFESLKAFLVVGTFQGFFVSDVKRWKLFAHLLSHGCIHCYSIILSFPFLELGPTFITGLLNYWWRNVAIVNFRKGALDLLSPLTFHTTTNYLPYFVVLQTFPDMTCCLHYDAVSLPYHICDTQLFVLVWRCRTHTYDRIWQES